MSENVGTLVNSASSYAERAMSSRLVGSWSEATAQEYQQITSRLLAEVTALAGKEKAINGNSNLSQTGQHDQVKIAVQDFIANLRWLGLEKSTRETKVGNLFGQLFILPASTRTDQAMRDGEIRGALWPLPPDQRDVQYLLAAEADNTEILRALKDAPLPLVSDEVMLRADDARAAMVQPSLYRSFVEAGQLLDEVSAILTDALNLGAEFGIEVPTNTDQLGPKIRTALNFGIDHRGGKGKKVLRTTSKDVTSKDPVGV